MEVNMKLEQDEMEGVDEKEWVAKYIFFNNIIFLMKIKDPFSN